MKFTNGYWLVKDGYAGNFASQAYDAEKSGDELIIHAPANPIANRGQTLGGVMLNVYYSSPMENVIKIRITHFEGIKNNGPEFQLKNEKAFCPEIKIAEKESVLTSGNLSARIQMNGGWNVTWQADGKTITKNDFRSTGYMQKPSQPEQHLFYDKMKTFMKDELSLGVGEYVYGFGERFGAFIKNGQTIDIWNSDGGTAGEQSYKNIPFYMTNRGYGVFVNDPGSVSFEVATEKVSRVQFSVPGESLEYFVIYGPTPKQILERYTALTGRPPLLPDWTYGLWLSTSFTTNYDEKTVMHFIDGMSERKIPLSVFHFDCFWMRGFHWCDFIWDKKTFPDPEGLLKRLHERGLKVCVWINSYIAQQSYLFKEGMENGYFLKKANGDVWQTDMWQNGMALVDFTNPDACVWYASKLDKLLDMGVDCFKTDFGERIPTDAVFSDGGDPVKHHNYYTYLYNKTVFDLLERKKGKGNAVLFARSATVGGQQFPVHWGGDCESTFESMAETLRGGLSLCLSGFAYWSHDIGGFEGKPDPALFKRWLEFGLLSSHSRLHGSTSYRVPWSIDEEASIVAKKFADIKISLLPKLLEAQKAAHEKGTPVMRAMMLEFPEDPACETLDRQYMLGSSVLVAPVFNQNGKVVYYLPKGKWKHLIDGRTMDLAENGKWMSEQYDIMNMPLWERI